MHTRILLFILLLTSLGVNAQNKPIVVEQKAIPTKESGYPKPIKKERYKVAIITPMFLDSVELEPTLTKIPKFMMPGLDFFKGIQIAADTLKQLGFKLDIYVHDSRSDSLNVNELIRSGTLDSMDFIIGNASVFDLKLLAEFGLEKKINFISAVSPADAGQEVNPYFTILQPRLVSHIEKLHKSISAKYPEDNVVFIHRNSVAERNALMYFKNDIVHPLPARFKEMELKTDEVDIRQLLNVIDSLHGTTIMLGIIDPAAAVKNLRLLLPYAKQYGIKVYCMPTMESIKSLGRPDEFPMMPVYYTTSYMIDKITPSSLYINREYKKHMGGYPSDVVYKGFESLYFFSNLMRKYGVPFNEHIGESAYSFITPYKIVPVKEKGNIKFYENKYLYLVRFENGIMTYE
jgi:hypothetical protein